MSTEQMYVGKGNNVPSTEQTAITATQTAPNAANSSKTPDERRTSLQRASADFFGIMPLSDYLEVIVDGMYRNLESNVGLHDQTPEEELAVTDKALLSVWTATRVVIGLTRIYEASQTQEVNRG